jgi:hypothetical protein
MLRACRERPRYGRAAEQRDELAASNVEHDGFLSASVRRNRQPTTAWPAGPWRRPELF